MKNGQTALNLIFVSAISALTYQTQIADKQQLTVEKLHVERINVMEPTGHPRLVIANSKHSPLPTKQGKVMTEFDPGPRPGFIFYNDEGSENGGFMFRGFHRDGKTEHGLHLSFDRYNQDQTLAMQHIEQDGMQVTGLNIIDRPNFPVDEYMRLMLAAEKGDKTAADQIALLEKTEQIHGSRRAFYGTLNQKAMLQLHDPQGKKRIEMAVGKDGEPQLLFYDAKGDIVLRLPEAQPMTKNSATK
jgi:hypothetical protein